jgi:EpsI family protein
MSSLSGRIWVAVAVVGVCTAFISWMSTGYDFRVRPTARPLSELPLRLGNWTGTLEETDPAISRVLDAETSYTRVYQAPGHVPISLHAAAWTSPNADLTAPHHPTQCYGGTGWRVVSRSTEPVKTSRGTLDISVIVFDANSARIVVAHWYQFGDHIYWTANEARKLQMGLWGAAEWPPTIKFMLATTGSDTAAAVERLKTLIIPIYEWSADL